MKGENIIQGIKSAGVLIRGEEVLAECLAAAAHPVAEFERMLSQGRQLGIQLHQQPTGFSIDAIRNAVSAWGVPNEARLFKLVVQSISPAMP